MKINWEKMSPFLLSLEQEDNDLFWVSVGIIVDNIDLAKLFINEVPEEYFEKYDWLKILRNASDLERALLEAKNDLIQEVNGDL